MNIAKMVADRKAKRDKNRKKNVNKIEREATYRQGEQKKDDDTPQDVKDLETMKARMEEELSKKYDFKPKKEIDHRLRLRKRPRNKK